MKVFCQAKKLGVNIDPAVVCQSVQWLINNQGNNGAFPEVHAVIHKEMNVSISSNSACVVNSVEGIMMVTYLSL